MSLIYFIIIRSKRRRAKEPKQLLFNSQVNKMCFIVLHSQGIGRQTVALEVWCSSLLFANCSQMLFSTCLNSNLCQVYSKWRQILNDDLTNSIQMHFETSWSGMLKISRFSFVLFLVEEGKTKALSLRTQFPILIKSKPSGNWSKALTQRQRWLLSIMDFIKPHIIHCLSTAHKTVLYTPDVKHITITLGSVFALV